MTQEKKKYFQKHLTEIATAVFVVSLCTVLWVSSDLMLNRPDRPDDAAGLVYPFSMKGIHVYISASDANCASLPWLIAILSFGCIAYAIGPRSSLPDLTPKRNGSHSNGVLLVTIAVVAGSFLLFGRWIADFLAAHGIVVNF